MSAVQGAADRSLDADFGADLETSTLRSLFKAHTSPAFSALVSLRAGVGPPGNPPSLATCEKVPTISNAEGATGVNRSPGEAGIKHESPDTITPPGAPPGNTSGRVYYISDALEAIQSSIGRSRERQRRVLELIMAGEVAHAKRFAECMRTSVQLECPPMAGGCGSDDNFQLITCDSRLCRVCQRRAMGQKAHQYGPEVADWAHPSMIRLSLPKRIEPDVEEIERAIGALRGAFGRLLRRKVPPDGDGWTWTGWKRDLRMIGERELARRWQKRYVEQGKWIPVREIMARGFYGIDLKQGADGTINVHMHVLADVPWLPQAALSSLWDDLIAAPVVDIRRIDGRDEQDAEAAAMEVVAYAAKPPEWETVEQEVAYMKALKGSKLVQPFGDLHGNVPETADRLCCSNCERAPRWWDYVGTVDAAYQTMKLLGASADGDRPPPGASGD